MGTYTHSSFSFLCQHPPRLQCEPSHLKQFRLLQRRPFFYVGKWSDWRETGRDHKRRKCELVFFGRGDREMWLFFIVHTWRFSYKLDQIYSLQGLSWCLKCNVMTRRAERICQSGGLQLTKKKKKKGKQGCKGFRCYLHWCVLDGWIHRAKHPISLHTWADVRGEHYYDPVMWGETAKKSRNLARYPRRSSGTRSFWRKKRQEEDFAAVVSQETSARF